MATHRLKTWPEFFAPLLDGTKTFEVRVNDRDFEVGDVLVLREWRPITKTYSGSEVFKRVTYILDEFPVPGVRLEACGREVVVMGLADLA